MARFSATIRTGAGSTTLPIFSLYSAAGSSPVLRSIKVTNTTATAVALQLVRLTTTGTQGAGVTARKYRTNSPAAASSAFTTHTVAPTIGDILQSYTLGAAVGSAVFDSFGDYGEDLPTGTANGIGLVVATGTGQVCDVVFEWDE